MIKHTLICILILFGLTTLNSQTISDYNLLIVEGTSSTNVKTELETMGHTVTIENSSSLIIGYDYSNYDAIIFLTNSAEPASMSEILALNNSNQLGIILMRGENAISSCNLGTSVTWSSSEFIIEDNSHYITQAFSNGTLDLGFTFKSNLTSINSDNTILGSVSSGNGSLVVNNIYRRVLCPYYGHSSGMPWTANAELLMDRIIAWVVSNSSLGIDDNVPLKKIELYPNPSNDLIQIRGLNHSEKYIVVNTLGVEVLKGIIFNNEGIDITSLSQGVYILKFSEYGESMKFLKN